jgi:hypothetical protein
MTNVRNNDQITYWIHYKGARLICFDEFPDFLDALAQANPNEVRRWYRVVGTPAYPYHLDRALLAGDEAAYEGMVQARRDGKL